MTFEYQTSGGVAGHIEADDRAQAIKLIQNQFGPGTIAVIDGKPVADTAANHDPHNWGAAFKAALD